MSTPRKPNTCKECGRPVPLNYRKCDECIVGGATQRARTLKQEAVAADGALLVRVERDVVLTCGHVVASRVRLGDEVRCPIHKRVERSTRVHDGTEVPMVQR